MTRPSSLNGRLAPNPMVDVLFMVPPDQRELMRSRIAVDFQATHLELILIGEGYRPDFTPAHQLERLTG